MNDKLDLVALKAKAQLKERYDKQLFRLKSQGKQTDCIESAVSKSVEGLINNKASALVVYGDPQSGKTEMMICLTAKLAAVLS